MPIYAYKCTDCGHEEEVLQKISDAPLTDCPVCRHASMVKQVTAAGFQLKGSGWYATDFRNKDSGKPAKSDGKTESANDAKTDSAPAPAPASPPAAAASSSTPACGSGGCGSCS
ncbi:MAG: FmdB family zinc ribbon protein [Burkholderiaceae bacterium]